MKGNIMIKTIKLSKIRISSVMQKCPPNPEKLKKKYSFYKLTGLFDSVIIVDKKYNLVDGYTSYLLAKMFGIKKIEVMVSHNEFKSNWL